MSKPVNPVMLSGGILTGNAIHQRHVLFGGTIKWFCWCHMCICIQKNLKKTKVTSWPLSQSLLDVHAAHYTLKYPSKVSTMTAVSWELNSLPACLIVSAKLTGRKTQITAVLSVIVLSEQRRWAQWPLQMSAPPKQPGLVPLGLYVSSHNFTLIH